MKLLRNLCYIYIICKRMSSSSSSSSSIHWFRKGLRLHDNPALVHACKNSKNVYPVFILDPAFAKPDIVGVNRYSFLLQSLTDLDNQLKKLGLRLFVAKGNPDDVLSTLVKKWNVNMITFEEDTEPYAIIRDKKIVDMFTVSNVVVSKHTSHTIHSIDEYILKSKGKEIKSYQSFETLFHTVKAPSLPLPSLSIDDIPSKASTTDYNDEEFKVPSLNDMGYNEVPTTSFPGGETEAIKRLNDTIRSRPHWVAAFEKPNTSPNSLEPSTTVLSPYLKFGCISARTVYHAVNDIIKKSSNCTKPPVSLHGQLLWREYFYYNSVVVPNFHKMVDNPSCRQIPWGRNEAHLEAFKNGKTGYPYIDAIMIQLKHEGWIHHLARHSVACFLTRGDLWQSWEEGVKIFDLYLLDADYALNNANWQWLSCSNFFYQYFRCYSPIEFGKKTDPSGAYIRKWIPKLKNYPDKYIYEPWKVPIASQRSYGCVIGDNSESGYPARLVDHAIISKENMGKMKAAYEVHNSSSASKTKYKLGNDGDGDDDDDDDGAKKSKKKQKK